MKRTCVSDNLPFGGDHCNPIKASGIFEKKSTRLWLPVSAYLIEHRIRSYSAEKYAGMIEKMGAQLCLPLHHNNARAKDEDLNAYFTAVNEILQAKGLSARGFNPEPYRWYSVQTGLFAE